MTRVLYSESVRLAGIKEQYDQGDVFALIEAIAICYEDKEQFPEWVSDAVGKAMHTLYTNTTTKNGLPTQDAEASFKRAKNRTLKALSLELQGMGVIRRRKKIQRDYSIAELIAEQSYVKGRGFRNIEKAINGIIQAAEDQECFNKDADYTMLRREARRLEIQQNNFESMRNIWKKHKKVFEEEFIYREEIEEQARNERSDWE